MDFFVHWQHVSSNALLCPHQTRHFPYPHSLPFPQRKGGRGEILHFKPNSCPSQCFEQLLDNSASMHPLCEFFPNFDWQIHSNLKDWAGYYESCTITLSPSSIENHFSATQKRNMILYSIVSLMSNTSRSSMFSFWQSFPQTKTWVLCVKCSILLASGTNL